MIYAWTEGRGNWIGPLVGVTIIMTGVFVVYTAVFNYLADAYTLYASSAIAAQSFVRNMTGAVFPLFVLKMYAAITYTWGTFLVACVALVLAVIPFVLFTFGPKIRARSKVYRQLQELK